MKSTTKRLLLLSGVSILVSMAAGAVPNYGPLECPDDHHLVVYKSGEIDAASVDRANSKAYDVCAASLPRANLSDAWKNPVQFVSHDPQSNRFVYVCFGCAPEGFRFEPDHLTLGPPDRRLPLGQWTRWLDRDDPGGKGDYETVSAFLSAGEVPCREPSRIECQTVDGRSAGQAGDSITCEVSVGAVCINMEQADGRCADYRVRFYCPDVTFSMH